VPDEERINLGAGEAILLDSLGARAIRVSPNDQIGVMVDLEGRLNRREDRHFGRYLLSPGQAAELVASLVAAAQRASQESSEGLNFGVEFERALAREQEHLVADDAERRGQ
jgi:hypothetical protein